MNTKQGLYTICFLFIVASLNPPEILLLAFILKDEERFKNMIKDIELVGRQAKPEFSSCVPRQLDVFLP